MAMNVISTIECCEVDGKESSAPVGKVGPQLRVESHWMKHNVVVLRIGDQSFSVLGPELAKAIANAMNR